MVEPDPPVHRPDRFEQVNIAERVRGGRRHGLFERAAYIRVSRKVVDLVRLALLDQAHDRANVPVLVIDLKKVLVLLEIKVAPPPHVAATRSPARGEHPVVLVEEGAAKIAAVLSRGTGHDRGFHGHPRCRSGLLRLYADRSTHVSTCPLFGSIA